MARPPSFLPTINFSSVSGAAGRSSKAMNPPPPLLPHRRTTVGGGHMSSFLLALFFITFALVLYLEDFTCTLLHPNSPLDSSLDSSASPEIGESDSSCNVFEGEWIYDEVGRPLYGEEECPYIQPQLTCQSHGRPDSGYQHWRWRPHGCALPSFDAVAMLERLQGKRMLYVGDSLNRGQFVSMLCLLHRSLSDSGKSLESNGPLTVFKATEYNATVEFYWAPFLLESNSDDAVMHRISDRIVKARSMDKHGVHWRGADVLVLNTYLWWNTGAKMKILEGRFEDEEREREIVEMETDDAYRMALTELVEWVYDNVDPTKSVVFFTSPSPTHERGEDWGGEEGGNCYGETSPVEGVPGFQVSTVSRSMLRVMEEVLTRTPPSATAVATINVLNITQLSEYRREAHTQIYKKQWSPLSPEQLANPRSYADCVHWCLPGLPDTWNELLYYKLLFS